MNNLRVSNEPDGSSPTAGTTPLSGGLPRGPRSFSMTAVTGTPRNAFFHYGNMPADTLVIVNPAAGGGKACDIATRVADYFYSQGCHADFVESKNEEDLRRRAAQAVVEGYRRVATLGGDGAFHHLVEATFGLDVILGFLPAGNGNDIAAGLGIPRDPIAAAAAFIASRPRPVDLVQVELAGSGRAALCAGAAGIGLDAEAARLANTRFRRWPGVTRYLAGAFNALGTFAPLEIEAEMDEKRWSGRVLLAAVANAPCYGAGVQIAPRAAMDDGWLDVTLVGAMPWTRVVEIIPIILGGRDWRLDDVWRFRAKRIALRPGRPAAVQGDGELLGEGAARFAVLAGAIRVAAPDGKLPSR
jgi:diacylglycerol kinase (ATP)